MSTTQQDIESYEKNGFVVIKNFLTSEQVQELKDEARKLMDQHISDPDQLLQLSDLGSRKWTGCVYGTKVWAEPGCLVEGKWILPPDQAVHKVGQGLQFDPDATMSKQIIYSKEMKDVVRTLTKHENPKITQIMYLMKQGRIGSAFKPHQDETYFPMDPPGNLFGVWIALDEASAENGCLEFVPASHKTVPLTRFFTRVEEQDPKDGYLYKYTGHADYEDPESEYEYVSCPVSAGDLVLIHGLVVHKSAPNKSPNPRWAWTFHAWEEKEGVSYKEGQFLDQPERLPSLYHTDPPEK